MREECQSILQLDKWILYLREICLPVKIIYITIKDGQVLPSSAKTLPSS